MEPCYFNSLLFSFSPTLIFSSVDSVFLSQYILSILQFLLCLLEILWIVNLFSSREWD
jgi:hypothetical protein